MKEKHSTVSVYSFTVKYVPPKNSSLNDHDTFVLTRILLGIDCYLNSTIQKFGNLLKFLFLHSTGRHCWSTLKSNTKLSKKIQGLLYFTQTLIAERAQILKCKSQWINKYQYTEICLILQFHSFLVISNFIHAVLKA
jgi:hypothetical protein